MARHRKRRKRDEDDSKLDPDDLRCTTCHQPIEDDCDVAWKPGEYCRHPWCHARERAAAARARP